MRWGAWQFGLPVRWLLRGNGFRQIAFEFQGPDGPGRNESVVSSSLPGDRLDLFKQNALLGWGIHNEQIHNYFDKKECVLQQIARCFDRLVLVPQERDA